MTTIQISIIVYEASPLDYPQYRHTALWLRFADASPSLIVHIIGASRDFQFESRETERPLDTQRYAKLVDVGPLTVAATSDQILRALRSVPINNADREFDCQKWVEDALRRFKDNGSLSTESYERGVDGMVDAIAEARDVED